MTNANACLAAGPIISVLATGIAVQWRRRSAARGARRGGGAFLRRASDALGIRQRPLLGVDQLELSDSLLLGNAGHDEL